MQASSSQIAEESKTDALILATLRQVLQPKFGTVQGEFENLNETEYQAALSEAYAKVKRRIENPEAEPVANLENYSATVAHNVFNRFIRKKYPVRSKLADDVRNSLDLDPRLAYWKIGGLAIGGKREWAGQPIRLSANGKLALEDPVRAAEQCYKSREPASLLTSDLLLTFFDWLRNPFGYDATVRFCFRSLGMREVEWNATDLTASEAADMRNRPEDAADARALAEFLWDQCRSLDPVRRGLFLLFEPAGENQEAICDQLVSVGVCTLSELAEAAGITFAQFAELRQQGRITYEVVGALYALTPKQVENIRRGVTDLLWRRLVAEGYQRERKP